MRKGVETRLDRHADRADPYALPASRGPQAHRRSGWQRACARDEAAPAGTLLRRWPDFWRWQRMLDEGAYATVSETGDAENISKSYVSRILRLALLAPGIVEAIVDERQPKGLRLADMLGNGPVIWEEQRRAFAFLFPLRSVPRAGCLS